VDHLLIFGRRHLESVLKGIRRALPGGPDRTRGVGQRCASEPVNRVPIGFGNVERRDRLGGLIHEYCRAARDDAAAVAAQAGNRSPPGATWPYRKGTCDQQPSGRFEPRFRLRSGPESGMIPHGSMYVGRLVAAAAVFVVACAAGYVLYHATNSVLAGGAVGVIGAAASFSGMVLTRPGRQVRGAPDTSSRSSTPGATNRVTSSIRVGTAKGKTHITGADLPAGGAGVSDVPISTDIDVRELSDESDVTGVRRRDPKD
jgi:hypothetical protein